MNIFPNQSFIEETPLEKGFGSYYDQKIRPKFKNIESARKRQLIIKPVMGIILFLVTIFVILIYSYPEFSPEIRNYFIDNQYLTNFIFFGVAFGIFAIKLFNDIRSPNSNTLGNQIKMMKKDVHKFFNGLVYKEYKNEDYFLKLDKKFNIMPAGGYVEDFIEWSYKDIKFIVGEFVDELFGIVIMFESDKDLYPNVVIRSSSLLGDKEDILNDDLPNYDKIQNIKSDNPEFDKIFNIYSDDPAGAKKLIETKHLAEKLKEIINLFQNARVDCGFSDNKLRLIIDMDERVFESIFVDKQIPISKPVDLILQSKIIINRLSLILSAMDILTRE